MRWPWLCWFNGGTSHQAAAKQKIKCWFLPEPHGEGRLKLLSCEDKAKPVSGLSYIFSLNLEEDWNRDKLLGAFTRDVYISWHRGKYFTCYSGWIYISCWLHRCGATGKLQSGGFIFSVYWQAQGRDVLTFLFCLAERMSWLAAAAQEDKCGNNAGCCSSAGAFHQVWQVPQKPGTYAKASKLYPGKQLQDWIEPAF